MLGPQLKLSQCRSPISKQFMDLEVPDPQREYNYYAPRTPKQSCKKHKGSFAEVEELEMILSKPAETQIQTDNTLLEMSPKVNLTRYRN